MKILVVKIDGLLVENTPDIPNADPLPHGKLFVQRLMDSEVSSSLFTAKHEDINAVRDWMKAIGLEPTWFLSTWGDLFEESIVRTQTFIGKQHGTISLFVSSSIPDSMRMADFGVPSVIFRHPDAYLQDREQEVGATWGKMQDSAQGFKV